MDTVVEIEAGSSGRLFVSHIANSLLEGFNVYGARPTGAKEIRAKILAGEMGAGRVFLPKQMKGRGDFLAEFRSFPDSANDDAVDATSQGVIHYLQKVGRLDKVDDEKVGLYVEKVSK